MNRRVGLLCLVVLLGAELGALPGAAQPRNLAEDAVEPLGNDPGLIPASPPAETGIIPVDDVLREGFRQGNGTGRQGFEVLATGLNAGKQAAQPMRYYADGLGADPTGPDARQGGFGDWRVVADGTDSAWTLSSQAARTGQKGFTTANQPDGSYPFNTRSMLVSPEMDLHNGLASRLEENGVPVSGFWGNTFGHTFNSVGAAGAPISIPPPGIPIPSPVDSLYEFRFDARFNLAFDRAGGQARDDVTVLVFTSPPQEVPREIPFCGPASHAFPFLYATRGSVDDVDSLEVGMGDEPCHFENRASDPVSWGRVYPGQFIDKYSGLNQYNVDGQRAFGSYQEWKRYTLDLSPWAGRSVWIAFLFQSVAPVDDSFFVPAAKFRGFELDNLELNGVAPAYSLRVRPFAEPSRTPLSCPTFPSCPVTILPGEPFRVVGEIVNMGYLEQEIQATLTLREEGSSDPFFPPLDIPLTPLPPGSILRVEFDYPPLFKSGNAPRYFEIELEVKRVVEEQLPVPSSVPRRTIRDDQLNRNLEANATDDSRVLLFAVDDTPDLEVGALARLSPSIPLSNAAHFVLPLKNLGVGPVVVAAAACLVDWAPYVDYARIDFNQPPICDASPLASSINQGKAGANVTFVLEGGGQTNLTWTAVPLVPGQYKVFTHVRSAFVGNPVPDLDWSNPSAFVTVDKLVPPPWQPLRSTFGTPPGKDAAEDLEIGNAFWSKVPTYPISFGSNIDFDGTQKINPFSAVVSSPGTVQIVNNATRLFLRVQGASMVRFDDLGDRQARQGEDAISAAAGDLHFDVASQSWIPDAESHGSVALSNGIHEFIRPLKQGGEDLSAGPGDLLGILLGSGASRFPGRAGEADGQGLSPKNGVLDDEMASWQRVRLAAAPTPPGENRVSLGFGVDGNPPPFIQTDPSDCSSLAAWSQSTLMEWGGRTEKWACAPYGLDGRSLLFEGASPDDGCNRKECPPYSFSLMVDNDMERRFELYSPPVAVENVAEPYLLLNHQFASQVWIVDTGGYTELQDSPSQYRNNFQVNIKGNHIVVPSAGRVLMETLDNGVWTNRVTLTPQVGDSPNSNAYASEKSIGIENGNARQIFNGKTGGLNNWNDAWDGGKGCLIGGWGPTPCSFWWPTGFQPLYQPVGASQAIGAAFEGSPWRVDRFPLFGNQPQFHPNLASDDQIQAIEAAGKTVRFVFQWFPSREPRADDPYLKWVRDYGWRIAGLAVQEGPRFARDLAVTNLNLEDALFDPTESGVGPDTVLRVRVEVKNNGLVNPGPAKVTLRGFDVASGLESTLVCEETGDLLSLEPEGPEQAAGVGSVVLSCPTGDEGGQLLLQASVHTPGTADDFPADNVLTNRRPYLVRAAPDVAALVGTSLPVGTVADRRFLEMQVENRGNVPLTGITVTRTFFSDTGSPLGKPREWVLSGTLDVGKQLSIRSLSPTPPITDADTAFDPPATGSYRVLFVAHAPDDVDPANDGQALVLHAQESLCANDFDQPPSCATLTVPSDGVIVPQGVWSLWRGPEETSYALRAGDPGNGELPANTDTVVNLPDVDLTTVKAATLSFRHRYDLETSFDAARVEICTAGTTGCGAQSPAWRALAPDPAPLFGLPNGYPDGKLLAGPLLDGKAERDAAAYTGKSPGWVPATFDLARESVMSRPAAVDAFSLEAFSAKAGKVPLRSATGDNQFLDQSWILDDEPSALHKQRLWWIQDEAYDVAPHTGQKMWWSGGGSGTNTQLDFTLPQTGCQASSKPLRSCVVTWWEWRGGSGDGDAGRREGSGGEMTATLVNPDADADGMSDALEAEYGWHGKYRPTLTVTSTSGTTVRSNSSSLAIHHDLATQNQLPESTLKAAPAAGGAPLAVKFEVTAKDNGSIVRYVLDYGDGSAPVEAKGPVPTSFQHTYAKVGNHTVRLRLVDDLGATSHAVAWVNVTGSGQRPSVKLTADVTSGSGPLTVTFRPEVGNLVGTVAYELDFGDGKRITGTGSPPANIPHTYRGTNQQAHDTDGDGWSDGLEYRAWAAGDLQADPLDNGKRPEDDGRPGQLGSNGVPDYLEPSGCSDDADGLSRILEAQHGTRNCSSDSDFDGFSDFQELTVLGSDPTVFDFGPRRGGIVRTDPSGWVMRAIDLTPFSHVPGQDFLLRFRYDAQTGALAQQANTQKSLGFFVDDVQFHVVDEVGTFSPVPGWSTPDLDALTLVGGEAGPWTVNNAGSGDGWRLVGMGAAGTPSSGTKNLGWNVEEVNLPGSGPRKVWRFGNPGDATGYPAGLDVRLVTPVVDLTTARGTMAQLRFDHQYGFEATTTVGASPFRMAIDGGAVEYQVYDEGHGVFGPWRQLAAGFRNFPSQTAFQGDAGSPGLARLGGSSEDVAAANAALQATGYTAIAPRGESMTSYDAPPGHGGYGTSFEAMNGTVQRSFGNWNPYPVSYVFSGSSGAVGNPGGWVHADWDIAPLLGQKVRFAFHAASNPSATLGGTVCGSSNPVKCGWSVANVAVHTNVFQGVPAKLRLHLATDGSNTKGEWLVDDLKIVGSQYRNQLSLITTTPLAFSQRPGDEVLLEGRLANLGSLPQTNLALAATAERAGTPVTIDLVAPEESFVPGAPGALAAAKDVPFRLRVVLPTDPPPSGCALGCPVKVRLFALKGTGTGFETPPVELAGATELEWSIIAEDSLRVVPVPPVVGRSAALVADPSSPTANTTVTFKAAFRNEGTLEPSLTAEWEWHRLLSKGGAAQPDTKEIEDESQTRTFTEPLGTLSRGQTLAAEASFTPELPGLYRVEVTLRDASGQEVAGSRARLELLVDTLGRYAHMDFTNATHAAAWGSVGVPFRHDGNALVWGVDDRQLAHGQNYCSSGGCNTVIRRSDRGGGTNPQSQNFRGLEGRSDGPLVDLSLVPQESAVLALEHRMGFTPSDGALLEAIPYRWQDVADTAVRVPVFLCGSAPMSFALEPQAGFNDEAQSVAGARGFVASGDQSYNWATPNRLHPLDEDGLESEKTDIMSGRGDAQVSLFDLNQRAKSTCNGSSLDVRLVNYTVRFRFHTGTLPGYTGSAAGVSPQPRDGDLGWRISLLDVSSAGVEVNPRSRVLPVAAGVPKEFRLEVRNAGQQADTFRLSYLNETSFLPAGAMLSFAQDSVFLEPGTAASVPYTIFLPVTAPAGGYYAVLEARSTTIPTVAATSEVIFGLQSLALPDLSVRLQVDAAGDPPALEQGRSEPYSLTARVFNLGGKEAAPVRLRFLAIDPDGVPLLIREVQVPTLCTAGPQCIGGGIFVSSVAWQPLGKTGNYTLRVEADPEGRLAETNLLNNVDSVPIQVTPYGAPDLEVASLEVEGLGLDGMSEAGDLLHIEATFRNKGTRPVQGAQLLLLYGSVPINETVDFAAGQVRTLNMTLPAFPGETLARAEAVAPGETCLGDGSACLQDNRRDRYLVSRRHNLSATLEPAVLHLEPGGTATTLLLLDSAGSGVERVFFRLANAKPWSLAADPALVSVAPGSQVGVELTLQAPANATAGSLILRLRAEPADNPKTGITLPLRVTVVPVGTVPLVDTPGVAAEPGARHLSVTLRNPGNIRQELEVLLADPPWGKPVQVELPPFANHTLDLPVEIPADAPPGFREGVLEVRNATGTMARHVVPLTVRPLPAASAEWVGTRVPGVAAPGVRSLHLNLQVRNTGNLPILAATAAGSLGEGLLVEGGEAAAALAPNATARIAVRVEAAADAPDPNDGSVDVWIRPLGADGSVGPAQRAATVRLPYIDNAPDLHVARLDWSPAGPLRAGDRVQFRIEVGNLGDRESPPSRLHAFVNGDLLDDPEIPAIPPGQSRLVNVSAVFEGPGPFLLTVLADGQGAIEEVQETNNGVARTLDVEPAPVLSPRGVSHLLPAPAAVAFLGVLLAAAAVARRGSGRKSR